MLNTFAHAGHSHTIESTLGVGTSNLDHCTPIIIGAGIIIALLLGVIVYLLKSIAAKKSIATTETKKSKK
jgi:hypothetical protein